MHAKELSTKFLAFQAQGLTPKIDRVKGPPLFTERSMYIIGGSCAIGSAFFHAHVQPCRVRPMSAAH